MSMCVHFVRKKLRFILTHSLVSSWAATYRWKLEYLREWTHVLETRAISLFSSGNLLRERRFPINCYQFHQRNLARCSSCLPLRACLGSQNILQNGNCEPRNTRKTPTWERTLQKIKWVLKKKCNRRIYRYIYILFVVHQREEQKWGGNAIVESRSDFSGEGQHRPLEKSRARNRDKKEVSTVQARTN